MLTDPVFERMEGVRRGREIKMGEDNDFTGICMGGELE